MFEDLIQTSAETYSVPPAWIQAVIDTESSWNPNAYRPEPKIHDASYGLMQVLEKTARRLGFSGTTDELFQPEVNIPLGTKLLGQLRERFGDDFRAVYSAYNSGSPTMWQTSSEVAAHVNRALASLQKYITQTAEEVAGVINQTTLNGESEALVGLIVLVLLWAWAGKRR